MATPARRTASDRAAWLAQVTEDILEPARPICDPHHHLWDHPNSRYLLDEWTAATIAGAPEHVRALATRSGTLRANQLLLTGLEVGDMFPFALWWPWGDGTRVSVRVGIAAAAERPKELSASIRSLFGL